EVADTIGTSFSSQPTQRRRKPEKIEGTPLDESPGDTQRCEGRVIGQTVLQRLPNQPAVVATTREIEPRNGRDVLAEIAPVLDFVFESHQGQQSCRQRRTGRQAD